MYMPKKQKQYTYDSNGQKRKLCPSIPVEGSRIIHSDPRELAAMDAESMKKHAEWLKIMAACEAFLHTH